MDIGLNDYLLIGAVMFVSGVVCMATKRNGIAVLMGVELVLNVAGPPTGSSSTTPSPSSPSSSTSSVPRPAASGLHSTSQKPKVNWWPAS